MAGTEHAIAEAQRRLWGLGDYPAVAQRLLPVSADLVDATAIGMGTRVLDVATGDGNAAVLAARRGAAVTGIDLSSDQLALARRRAAAEGLTVALGQGDAEALPVPDGAFDVVVSVAGMIFAPDHRRAAAEMVRACRAGGTIGVVSWLDAGWFRAWRAGAAELVPPPPSGVPHPEAWGDPAELRCRLLAAGAEAVRVDERPFHWRFPTVDEAADFFLRASAPFLAFRQAAAAAGRGDEVRPLLLETLAAANGATDGTCLLVAPYLRAIGRRPPG